MPCFTFTTSLHCFKEIITKKTVSDSVITKEGDARTITVDKATQRTFQITSTDLFGQRLCNRRRE
jgi:hypothetical protein